MRKAAALLSLALFAALSAWPAAFAEPVSVPVTVTYGQTEARTMLQMINGFRAGTRQDAPEGTAVPGHPWQRTQDGGIEALDPRGALVYDAQLERIAMLRAAEIAILFEHTRPNGSEWSSVEGFSAYAYSGENIAAGYQTAEAAFTGWMETDDPYGGQGHRRNMLSDRFTAVGIGHVVYDGMHYWTQEFGTPFSGQPQTPGPAADDTRTMTLEADPGFLSYQLPDPELTAYLFVNETLDLKTVACLSSGDPYFTQRFALPADYTSSDPAVVSVTEDGIATAHAPGGATVRATAKDGAYDVTVHLTAGYDFDRVSVGTADGRAYFRVGEPGKLVPVTEPEGAIVITRFEAFDDETATLDEEGNLVFHKPGEVTVWMYCSHAGQTAARGVSGRYTAVAADFVDYDEVKMGRSGYRYPFRVGETFRVYPVITPEGASATTWFESTNPDVATVDEAGTVAIVGAGKAEIRLYYRRAWKTGGYTYTGCIVEAKERIDLSGAEVTTEEPAYPYTGEPIEPPVTVRLGGERLFGTVDYDVSYADNTGVGTATVTVTGKEDYTGTASCTFRIVEAPSNRLEDADVALPPGDLVYTGEALRPEVTVTLNGSRLTRGVDYEAAYADNVHAGQASVTVTGMGAYVGGQTVRFPIAPRGTDGFRYWISGEEYLNRDGAVVTFYSGAEKRPLSDGNGAIGIPGPSQGNADGSLTEGWLLLQEGRDYALVYENNRNAGAATARVTCRGDFTGVCEIPFAILAPDLSAAEAEGTPHCVFSPDPACGYLPDGTGTDRPYYLWQGLAIEPKVTLTSLWYTDAGGAQRGDVIPEADYEVSYEGSGAPGTATLTIRPSGTGNLKGSRTWRYEILPEPSVEVTLETERLTYTGRPAEPAVTGVVAVLPGGGREEIPKDSFLVAYEDNVNAGTGKAVVTVSGTHAGVYEKTFVIGPAPLSSAEAEPRCSPESLTAGRAQTAQLRAVREGITFDPPDLVSGRDFTVVSAEFSEGLFRIRLRGVGNYAGDRTFTAALRQPEYPEDMPETAARLPAGLRALRPRALSDTHVSVLDLRAVSMETCAGIAEALGGNENLRAVLLPPVSSVGGLETLPSRLPLRPGLWLVFGGTMDPADRAALDTLSFENGVLYRFEEAGDE